MRFWRVSVRNISCGIVISILIIYLYYVYTVFSSFDDDHQNLIIFKLPRSGSSWITSLLNSSPDVFLMKEIIQREDMSIFTLEERESHLKLALERPEDKLRNSANILPSHRFWNDFYREGKFRAPRIIGFTINHEYCTGIRWNHVISKSKKLRVLVYVRTNIMKQAFSAIHGKLLHEKCGASNVRTSQTCHIKLPLPVNVTDFYSTVSLFAERQDSLLRFVRQHFSEYLISIITYEELLKDSSKLFHSLQLTLPARANGGGKSSEWKKRSPDNLTQCIQNVNELRNPLLLSLECQELRNQLDDVEGKIFPLAEDHRVLQGNWINLWLWLRSGNKYVRWKYENGEQYYNLPIYCFAGQLRCTCQHIIIRKN